MLIQTATLAGLCLDWAVADATGYDNLYMADYGRLFSRVKDYGVSAPGVRRIKPSTDASQGGQFIVNNSIAVMLTEFEGDDQKRYAASVGAMRRPNGGSGTINSPVSWFYGPTYLVAGLRSFVHGRKGWSIDLPRNLVEHVRTNDKNHSNNRSALS